LARALATLLIACPFTAQATTAWVVSSTEKVRPSAAAVPLAGAELAAARNEFEAFQIAVAGPLSGVSATATAFTGPAVLPAPRLFREAIITLANPSGPDGVTGPFPDALIPDVDDVVGEKRNAFPFDVPAGEARALWIEAFVPASAPPGQYTATVTVRATGQADLTIPVSLTVWNFTLPSTSSLKSHFGLYYGDLPAAHGVSGDAFSTLRARYAQLGLDHRISISDLDDGNGDLNHYAAFYGALFDGRAPTQLQGARLTSAQYAGPGDPANSTAGHAQWAAFFKGKGWFDRLFDYTCDEPNSPRCQWSDLQSRAALVKAGDPEFRVLTTATVTDATQQGAAGTIDLIVPVLNYMQDKTGPFAGEQRAAYDAFLASGPRKELWMYQSCMSHGCGGTSEYFRGWASYAIDASAVRHRAMEWLSFRFDVTGELYYETTQAYAGGAPWTNQWDYSGNGDGTLLYPGTPGAIGGQTDIPVASLRLKMIREGMEDYEYLKAVADLGDGALAKQVAARLFPDPWTQPTVADLFAARQQLAARILELTGSAPAAPGGATSGGTTSGTTAASGTSAGTGAASSGAGAQSVSRLVGSGCTSGQGAEALAALGILAAIGARRRRPFRT
ncbi:MAG TPA: glycoside hydrolase domain-containing protein, partial [Anaeromyxobacteraceae bacterium]